MYRLIKYTEFERKLKKIARKDKSLKNDFIDVLIQMRENPFARSLKSHKVNARDYGYVYSSRVTSDIRIIWKFDEQTKQIILLLTAGTHSGKYKVYK